MERARRAQSAARTQRGADGDSLHETQAGQRHRDVPLAPSHYSFQPSAADVKAQNPEQHRRVRQTSAD